MIQKAPYNRSASGWTSNLKGYALCRRPPLSGRGLRGGGYVALAHLPCWVYWLLVVLRALVFLEASCFLELGFYCFSSCSCYFGHEFCYFGCPKPIIWRPVASILPPWGPFCQLGDTLGDHGSSRKDTWGSEARFLVILVWFWDRILKTIWVLMG